MSWPPSPSHSPVLTPREKTPPSPASLEKLQKVMEARSRMVRLDGAAMLCQAILCQGDFMPSDVMPSDVMPRAMLSQVQLYAKRSYAKRPFCQERC